MKITILLAAAVPLLAQQASVDFGYRVTDTHGNQDAYRSILNLGDGPKLFGLNLEWKDVTFQMNNWGGDPYNTMRLEAQREKLYRLTWNYRNLAYFNHLPSFAFGKQYNDLHRRLSDLELELRPGSKIVPFFGWTHDNGSGRGVSSFVLDATNSYTVAGNLKDRTDLFRGGARLEFHKWHWIVEQGGTLFKQDDTQFNTQPNNGDRGAPFFGQQLQLTDLNRAYGYTGNTLYSKAVVTGNPYSWMDITGQFLYSRPAIDGNYSSDARGRFVLLDLLLFHNAQRGTALLEAKQPHSSGNVTIEIRPASRLRVVENWLTDRLHNASSIYAAETLPLQVSSYAFDRLAWNYSQQQVDVFFDATSKLTFRGGHRYLWGDSGIRQPTLLGLSSGELRRHAGIAGVNYRVSSKLTVNGDFEVSAGDRSYFRTSLQEYKKLRARATYRPFTALSLTATTQVLENHNPLKEGGYDFSNRTSSLAFSWTPGAGKRFGVNGSYTRAAIRSEIPYLIPQDWVFLRSLYRENAHLMNAFFDCSWHGVKFSAGGAAYLSAGSRPTEFYQPVVRVLAPLRKHMAWKGEWRWNGLGGPESFSAHLLAIGLVLTR